MGGRVGDGIYIGVHFIQVATYANEIRNKLPILRIKGNICM